MSTGDMFAALPAMLRAFGTKTPRMIGAFNAIEKVHPKEEHYYLEALGTRQDMQSKGVGSAVIRHMLDRCDTEGMPAYLESSNLRNVPFYARHGFETTGEIVCRQGRTDGDRHVARPALSTSRPEPALASSDESCV